MNNEKATATLAALELDKDTLGLLQKTFEALDKDKTGAISTDLVGTVLEMLGSPMNDDQLKVIIAEFDGDKSGELKFEQFAVLASRFLTEEEEIDIEVITRELREAFRLYDKEGEGFITTGVLREILKELDDNITSEDLDNMIEEIDADGSGTVDFDEFLAVMTG